MSFTPKKVNDYDHVQKPLFPFEVKKNALSSSIFGTSKEEKIDEKVQNVKVSSIFDDKRSAQFRNASESLHKAHNVSMKKRPQSLITDGKEGGSLEENQEDIDAILKMRERRRNRPSSSKACQLITFDFNSEVSSTLKVSDMNDKSKLSDDSDENSSEVTDDSRHEEESELQNSDDDGYFNGVNISKSEHEQLIVEEELQIAVSSVADIFLEKGVVVLKSDHHNSSTEKSNLIPPDLMRKMVHAAKQIENEICNKLDEKGNSWRVDNSIWNHNNQYSHSEKKKSTKCEESPYNWRYQEVACRCPGRLDVRYKLDQPPFNDHSIIYNEFLTPLIHHLFGGSGIHPSNECDGEMQNYLVYSGLIYSFPGSSDQPWHTDGTTLFPEARSLLDLPPYALNVFIPLNDITPDVGPTEFIPSSHLAEQALVIEESLMQFATCASRTKEKRQRNNKKTDVRSKDPQISEEEWLDRHSVIAPTLNVGDALLYDYRVCHRGTRNLSQEGKTRMMLYLLFARPWFKEHLNFGGDYLFPTENKVKDRNESKSLRT